ncbi:hypothetical protein O9G_005301 [Rozella allomycis CSF55]|uniref:Uncharacterized protein n=1 Tax=Rozella allomycis (strain CSF55) TaxID=988480 RepID=A0A075AUV9_ROZAC|nr:hypothetical protein O9G_005301 [Rozella allomycis CSF55]|eukprot:EPZ34066.1 hypothetical protein O9G_005301 [Rozella allomycis CSF55]
MHGRTKHIEERYHHVRDYVQKGIIKIEYEKSKDHISDILTKGLSQELNDYRRSKMGVMKSREGVRMINDDLIKKINGTMDGFGDIIKSGNVIGSKVSDAGNL